MNNTIVAGTIDVGDNSMVTPGLGVALGPNNSSNPNNLFLGSGMVGGGSFTHTYTATPA